MELYKKCGVSPMGGCIPMLIQMPILIAMFRFLPASIELRGQHFLWAEDLSSYDSVLQLPFKFPSTATTSACSPCSWHSPCSSTRA